MSVYAPVAVSCCCVPFAMVDAAGVTEMETRLAAVTVSGEVLARVPTVARIVTDPGCSDCARPSYPAALLIDAIVGIDDDQMTEPVRFCVE